MAMDKTPWQMPIPSPPRKPNHARIIITLAISTTAVCAALVIVSNAIFGGG